MSDYVVAKPFKTLIQRFAVGAVVNLTDDLLPHTFADLKDRGFIKQQRIDYDAMTKVDLEALAAERGVDISAAHTKADIVAALQYAGKRDDAILRENFDALLKGDLETLATERGLDISGAKTKAELVALLQSHSPPAPAELTV